MIDQINNGEQALSVRNKLNNVITKANDIQRGYAGIYYENGTEQTVTNNEAFKLSIPSNTEIITPLNFTTGNNLITNTNNSKIVFATSTIIVSGITNTRLSFYIAKNNIILPQSRNIVRVAGGGDALRQVVIQNIIELGIGDELSVWAKNEQNTDNFTLLLLNSMVQSI